ncbi:hypothetical protein ACT8ZV_00265 [Nocardioides sp. MAHUQ-72]|uniref:hypothetical protein n=1 Tax=unclassified Nocardioides TaxID=2615069 RepID=UPI00361F1794
MTETQQCSPDYAWAISSEPDYLVVQFPPLVAGQGGRAVDAMRTLFKARGFAEATTLENARPPVANGCMLSEIDSSTAELIVQIGSSAGRIAIPHGDPAWSARVLEEKEVLVLACDAVIVDGAIQRQRQRLEREVAAGGVLAARVPAGRP